MAGKGMFDNEFKPLTSEKGWNYVSGVPETEEQQRLRFQIELEFVQCLGNPNYLNCKLPNLKRQEKSIIKHFLYNSSLGTAWLF